MSLLDHPEAQALLADAKVSPDDVRGCRDHITRFLKRYLPLFYRQEQRGHAAAFVRGLLSGLERKSVEPIAAQAGIPRKNLELFVGCGIWDDEKVMAHLGTVPNWPKSAVFRWVQTVWLRAWHVHAASGS